MFSFFRIPELEFDDACVRSFTVARLFAAHNGRAEITPADLFRGLLHTTAPESVEFLQAMQFGYGDEVETLNNLPSGERSRLGRGLRYANALKKILARANRKAGEEKRGKVAFVNLIHGFLLERPTDVASELARVGRSWDDLERHAKTAGQPPGPASGLASGRGAS